MCTWFSLSPFQCHFWVKGRGRKTSVFSRKLKAQCLFLASCKRRSKYVVFWWAKDVWEQPHYVRLKNRSCSTRENWGRDFDGGLLMYQVLNYAMLNSRSGHRWVAPVKLPHPAEVVEGLRVDNLRQVPDDEVETLFLQLGRETPHLLGPLDLGEAAHQLLAATQRGHGISHGLNRRQLSAKSLLRGESMKCS